MSTCTATRLEGMWALAWTYGSRIGCVIKSKVLERYPKYHTSEKDRYISSSLNDMAGGISTLGSAIFFFKSKK